MLEELPLYGRKTPEMATVPQGELVRMCKFSQARDIVLFSQVLVSEVGREKAAELVRKVRYDYYYKLGRAAAEKLDNPEDLDSLLNAYFLKTPSPMPVWVPCGQFTYRAENKAIYRSSNYCFEAEAFKRQEVDEDMLEFLARNYCIHDLAWAEGFNPKIKFEIPKHFLLGDNCCEFALEI